MNNFYTILVIPEKTKHLKKIILPSVYVRVGLLLGAVGSFFVAFMVYDYVNVMQQLVENKRLQTENRQLKQQMQTFTTKLQTVQDTLERIQNYKIKLQIITGQTGGGQDVEVLKKRVAPEIPGLPMDDHTDSPATKQRKDQSRNLMPTTGLLASTDPMDTIRLAEDIQKKAQKETATPVPNNEEGAVEPGPEALPPSETVQDSIGDEKKTLSDFIREDEERESAALRDEFEKLHLAFGSVLNHARALELDVQALHSKLIDQKDELASLPTLRPTNGWYTSGFGERNSPFTGKPTMHEGLDIANHVGSAIYAPAVGVVTFAGARPGYGYLITINHGYDTQTQYGHVSKIYVKPGEKVKRGQKIGAVGNTGRSTGPHVHYEVRRNGIPVNPLFHILED